jgi:hypothetical protein
VRYIMVWREWGDSYLIAHQILIYFAVNICAI